MPQKRVLQQHMECVVDGCRKLLPDLSAVILYGGFGRDEGSWYQDEQGQWRPYNDYDICIVAPRKAPQPALRDLKERLAAEIGIKWIDLGQYSPQELTRFQPSILNYDFKNASKVIHGDLSLLDLVPDIDPSALPMKEVQTLFFTRLFTLIGSLDGKGPDASLQGEACRFFRNQMAKALLAIVDVLLLAKGAYHASYCERVARAARLYPEKEQLLELSRWALSEKLRPQAPDMCREEVRALYGMVQRHFLAEMYRGLGCHYGKEVRGPADIERFMKWLPTPLVKRLYWLMKFRDLRMERQISVMLAQSFLAAAWSPEGVDATWLSRALSLLGTVDPRLQGQLSWDQARLEAARLRMVV